MSATFTARDASTGQEILRGPLPLNRICLHLGGSYIHGAGRAGAAARQLTDDVGRPGGR